MRDITWNMSINSLAVCPRTNGIYKITNTKNGKFYIGRAEGKKGFFRRWYEHRRSLRKNSHGCAYLQRSYNKYGESCFTFEVLEVRDYGEPLADLESEYIVNLEAMWFQKGYNMINKKTEFPNFVREDNPNAKEFELLDPNGNLVSGKNLAKFCEDVGVLVCGLGEVLRGNRKSYKGFRSPKPEFYSPPKEYRLLSPEKRLVIFDNTMEFARQIGVSQSSVSRVLKGVDSNVKGYHLENPPPKHQKNIDRVLNKKLLVNKSLGVIIKFVSIRAFSLNYKVPIESLNHFLAGKGNHFTKNHNWDAPTEEDMKSYPIIEEDF